MKKLIVTLAAVAMLTAACTPEVTIEVEAPATTTTQAPVTTTVPPTTTTEAPAETDDTYLDEQAYLFTLEGILTQEYGDDDTLLELGYEFCDLMAMARAQGWSVGDYQENIMDNFDAELWLDALFMSGAASGSLCDEHFEWVMEVEGMDA